MTEAERAARLVLAVGGNALSSEAHGTIADEFASAEPLAAVVARLAAAGTQVAVTHGNGPQVGFELRRSELTANLPDRLPELPLDYCDAETQGGLGYVLVNRIAAAMTAQRLEPKVAAVVTQTVVAGDDPAFAHPTKPVGRFYSEAEAEVLRAEGWAVVEDAGRGYRRVVPSPDPLEVVEAPAVMALLDAGFVVVAAGGGGIPVARAASGSLRGVRAVVDKDLASAVLATAIGAGRLVIATAVERVALDYGRPGQRFLDTMTVAEARGYLAAGEFAPGSMGPKVEAAVRFVAAGGRDAVITSVAGVEAALAGRAGTRVTPG